MNNELLKFHYSSFNVRYSKFQAESGRKNGLNFECLIRMCANFTCLRQVSAKGARIYLATFAISFAFFAVKFTLPPTDTPPPNF